MWTLKKYLQIRSAKKSVHEDSMNNSISFGETQALHHQPNEHDILQTYCLNKNYQELSTLLDKKSVVSMNAEINIQVSIHIENQSTPCLAKNWLTYASLMGDTTLLSILLRALTKNDESIVLDWDLPFPILTTLISNGDTKHLEVAKLLIEAGIDVSTPLKEIYPYSEEYPQGESLNSSAALVAALQANQGPLAKLLIERGARVHPAFIQEMKGESAFSKEMMQLLNESTKKCDEAINHMAVKVLNQHHK